MWLVKQGVDRFEQAFRDYSRYIFTVYSQLILCVFIEMMVLIYYIHKQDFTTLLIFAIFILLTYLLFIDLKNEKFSDEVGSPKYKFLMTFLGYGFCDGYQVIMIDRKQAQIILKTQNSRLYTIDRLHRTVCDHESREFYSFDDFFSMATGQSLHY